MVLIDKIIGDKISCYRSKVINLIKDMISNPMINPPGRHYMVFTSFIEMVLYELGFRVLEYPVHKKELIRYGLGEDSEDRNKCYCC